MTLYSLPNKQIEEENKRLKILDSYGILDTLPEKEFDDITRLASFICDTEVSLVALMDRKRNWYKSKHGPVPFNEMERSESFCHYTIQDNDILEIPDTQKDRRWSDNAVVVGEPNVRYYAGYPLINDDGYKLGTLCIVDFVPKKLSLIQRQALRTLANQVMINFELRKQKQELESEQLKLSRSNARLKLFAQVVSHDLKQPLNNLRALYDLHFSSPEEKENISEMISICFDRMTGMIDGVLKFAETGTDKGQLEMTDIRRLVLELVDSLAVKSQIQFEIDVPSIIVRTNKILLYQVLQNLVCNAIKFNDKGKAGKVKITAKKNNAALDFQIIDNGPGIESKYHQVIFEPFKRLVPKEKVDGSGLGLATVAQIIQDRDGEVYLESEPGNGAVFKFTWIP